MFHLMFVHYTFRLVRFWLLSGHLLGNSCPLGWPFVLIVFCLFVFLAHLSRRLIGELIVYKGIRRPSVRRPSVNIFKRHLL